MIKNYYNLALVALCVGGILSCTPSAPYEIKSPCVAGGRDVGGEYSITPCTRRPINTYYDIA